MKTILDLLKYFFIICTALLGIFSLYRDPEKNTGLLKNKKLIVILILITMMASGIIQFFETQIKNEQDSQALSHRNLQEAELKLIIDSAKAVSSDLKELSFDQKNLMHLSSRQLYPIKEFKVFFSLAYFFDENNSVAKAYFQRIPATEPKLYPNVDESSPYYPLASDKAENKLRQLLHDPNMRIEFTLPGHKTPSLAFSNNHNYVAPKYTVERVNGNRMIVCDITYDTSKIWVDDGAVVSIIDLIGSTLTLRLDPLAPIGTKLGGITFTLRGIQSLGDGLANNKHSMLLKKENRIRIKGYDMKESIIAYRKVLSASDLGLPMN
jgi:hypothetical protein